MIRPMTPQHYYDLARPELEKLWNERIEKPEGRGPFGWTLAMSELFPCHWPPAGDADATICIYSVMECRDPHSLSDGIWRTEPWGAAVIALLPPSPAKIHLIDSKPTAYIQGVTPVSSHLAGVLKAGSLAREILLQSLSRQEPPSESDARVLREYYRAIEMTDGRAFPRAREERSDFFRWLSGHP